MGKLNRICAVAILTAALAVSAFAGTIDSPGVAAPPPPPSGASTTSSSVTTTVILTTGDPSFVFAVADSSEGGTRADGNYVLTVADWEHIIELDFPLTSPRLLKQSLRRIGLLAEIVNTFRDKIHNEADLIKQHRQRK